MVEFCVGLGQEHPEGVLQLSDTEAFLAFKCDSHMVSAMCNLTAAIVWQGKPIMLHILPPKGRQVRDYIAMRNSHQSGAQMHVQVGS